MSSQCPKKKVRAVDDVTVASQVGSQDTTMVGAIGSFSDFDSVSEGIPEPRDGGAKICSVGVPSVCAEESVDIEVDSGAEVLGARILGLEAGDVRGDVVNLLVRFRVMDIGKALLSTQDLSWCGWETVFPADCGDASFVRKA